jgi:acylphosphatase
MTGSQHRYVVRFHGRVQGVGFRATCLAQAFDLPIHGFVRNEPDGSVLMDAEGDLADLKKLLARIRSVMSHNIDDVLIDERPASNRQDGFHISG